MGDLEKLIVRMGDHSELEYQIQILNGEFDWDNHVVIDKDIYLELKAYMEVEGECM